MPDSSWKRSESAWFHAAKVGSFTHYLAECHGPDGDMNPDKWNRQVDSVDVDRLASTLAEAGMRYHFLTIGQNSGYYCSPNSTYDEIVGYHPSHMSRRDLVADLAEALKKVGIRAMAYLPNCAPCNDRQALERLKCTPAWDAPSLPKANYTVQPDLDERLTQSQLYWEAIIREWSLRWGSSIHGWWIDGCYYAERMYRHPDTPNFRSFAEAMKAGNPESLVAFNPGVRLPVISHTEYEDYTAGEVNELPAPNRYHPFRRYINGAQFHVLSYLGLWWGQGEPRFPDDLAARYTRYIADGEGVMTWDIPILPDGRIPDAYRRQLAAISAAMP